MIFSMNLNEVNFNENLNEDYSSLVNHNKACFKLNQNPYKVDLTPNLNIDFYSLQYLKEIAKCDNLNKNKKEQDNLKVDSILETKNSFGTDLFQISKKANSKSKVRFEHNFGEHEEKKGKEMKN